MATHMPKSMNAAGLIIYRWNGQMPAEFLFLQASYGRRHWTPPKGFVDENEDALATAIRETKEEAGLTDKDYLVCHEFHRTLNYFDPSKNKDKRVDFWLARLRNFDQPVILSKEHQDFRWLQLEDACRMGGYADMAKLLREADQFIANQ